ncbi:MAG TPA: UDP-glucuronic acid decarboxylase family protein [Terriglobia bacterium]|nr:UDP-glucuronic acid decarboxylase family protein [Terriglobia bacterium]
MRIVITGGAGFLGTHLSAKMLSLGHEVLCLDNLITGRRQNIEDLEKNPNFKFADQDVSKPIQIEGAVDAVAHLASPASPPDYLRFPIQTLKVGALGTHNALGLAMAKGARFLLASTSEVYGDPLVNPQPESYWGNVNPIGPRGVYDEAKRFAEALAIAYYRQHALDVRVVRIFNTYGPWMRASDGRVISNFVTQALSGKDITIYGDGSQTRSFCYVSDTVEGITRLLLFDSGSSGSSETGLAEGIHHPVNMGNPREVKVIDIARVVLEMTGSPSKIELLPLPTDDPKVRCPDISRARKLLGWEPQVSLEEGLAKTIAFFRQA